MKETFTHPNLKLLVAASAGLLGASIAPAQQLNGTISPGVAAISPTTTPLETGPTLDVVPYVLADGYTINLALIPSDLEFTGYTPLSSLNLPQLNSGAVAGVNAVLLPTVLPTYTVRQVVTTVNVWDNQTVVLGGLITSTVNNSKSQVPILGDIPLLGRLFQSQSKQSQKGNLMIFVTATVVDPSGSRVHSDDELPFAQTGVPVQSPENLSPTVSEKTVVGLPGAVK